MRDFFQAWFFYLFFVTEIIIHDKRCLHHLHREAASHSLLQTYETYPICEELDAFNRNGPYDSNGPQQSFANTLPLSNSMNYRNN